MFPRSVLLHTANLKTSLLSGRGIHESFHCQLTTQRSSRRITLHYSPKLTSRKAWTNHEERQLTSEGQIPLETSTNEFTVRALAADSAVPLFQSRSGCRRRRRMTSADNCSVWVLAANGTIPLNQSRSGCRGRCRMTPTNKFPVRALAADGAIPLNQSRNRSRDRSRRMAPAFNGAVRGTTADITIHGPRRRYVRCGRTECQSNDDERSKGESKLHFKVVGRTETDIRGPRSLHPLTYTEYNIRRR
jgi:hypothetical protein